ncbi:MAG: acetylxylan esterase, partial [Candidatus Brockarchaeota archaeon]|nr:acetylxylan esterase [Candidatus Brockarchaeota archaeon]
MNVYEYLCKEAGRITDASLSDLKDRGYWERTEGERRAIFADMLGLTERLGSKSLPVKPVVTGTLERRGYRIEKLHFQSLPGLYVTGNLYVPGSERSAPGVLYVCGHSPDQKCHYQAHARKFAQLGLVALVVETIELGEIRGHHHGPFHYGWFNWYSMGYTPAGVEVWNAMRAIDVLQSRPEVDPSKIGITGISGGGSISWF